MNRSNYRNHRRGLSKAPTGIHGLDEITFGGLPKGRTTLICGSAGCGKTMISMELLVRGDMQYTVPGVFIAFNRSAEALNKNVAARGYDVDIQSQHHYYNLD